MKFDDDFWKKPDSWLSAIILDAEKNQVYGRVKNDLALLRSFHPKTQFNYLDVVEVIGPIGTQMYRDDEVTVYKAIKLSQSSGNKTFRYEATISDHSTYFDLLSWFDSKQQKTEITFKKKFDRAEWLQVFCSAKNIEEVQHILHGYSTSKNKMFDALFGIEKPFKYRNIKPV